MENEDGINRSAGLQRQSRAKEGVTGRSEAVQI